MNTALHNKKQPIMHHLKMLQAERQHATSSAQRSQKRRFARIDFSGKALLDWLQLLAAFAIPLAVAGGTSWFSYQQNQTSTQIAADQQQEATLKAYLDDMSNLLLTYKLQASLEDSNLRYIARAKTLTALQSLNGPRKGSLVRFLYETQLINIKNPIVDLADADLRGAHLSGAALYGADLSGTNLSGADLTYTNLNGTSLSGANLRFADLSHATLIGVSLRKADLSNAVLIDVDLSGLDRYGANLSNIQR